MVTGITSAPKDDRSSFPAEATGEDSSQMTSRSSIKTGSLHPTTKDAAIRSIFDATYYAKAAGARFQSAAKAYAHYKKHGVALGAPPSPLFDLDHYRSQLRGQQIADPVSHYLQTGSRLGLSPHPLFDPAFYARAVGGVPEGWTALGHYLQVGWKLGASPHPLFDPAFYCLASGIDPAKQEPIGHYLAQERFEAAPHYLFSDSIYLAGQHVSRDRHGLAPLVHYVAIGHRKGANVHPLFDAGHYAAEVRKACERAGDDTLLKSLDGADPLRHYVERGVALGLTSTPYFDPDFLRSQVVVPDGVDPMRHYLTPHVHAIASPHPAIDLAHYVKQTGLDPMEAPSILHLMATPQHQRVSPHPSFDPIHYLAANPDLRDPGLCPTMHFLSHGMREDRVPNAIFSPEYVREAHPGLSFTDVGALQHYLRTKAHERLRVVFVSHDASLTGAPGTVLRLMEDFAHLPNVECIGIVARGGPRLPDFKRAGHVIVPGAPFHATTHDQRQMIVDGILSATKGNPPIAAIVNSAESRLMGETLAKAGIPIITLVHEAADLYPDGAFETISENASRIVFGSQYVFDRALDAIPLPEWQAEVRGQGMQQDHVGRMPRDLARRLILEELDLPDDVFLVLGCGTIDYRKGVDFYVAAALDLLSRPGMDKACFVWIGESHDTHSTLHSFIANEIRTRDRNGRVRFIGGRTDVEPYFVGADAFLMASRVDPFPCVAQEAMAAGLPIVAFREGGGTVEMLEDVAGVCVPMNDTGAMADAVEGFMKDRDAAAAMGRKGRGLIRSKWRAHDYFRYMAGQVAHVANIPETLLLDGMVPERDPEAPRIHFLFDEWKRSPLTDRVESLVRRLREDGQDASILLTRGRFDDTHERPAVPHVHLQPENSTYENGRWRTTPAEVIGALQRFARDQQPCVLVVVQDELALAGAAALPHGTAAIGMLHGSSPEELEALYASGSHLERIVSTSQIGRDELTALNPAWSGKTAVIPWSSEAKPFRRSKRPNAIHVRVDLRSAQSAAELRAVVLSLREKDDHVRIVANVDPMPPAKLRSAAMRVGLDVADVVASPDQRALHEILRTTAVTVVIGGDVSSTALIADAMALGSTPVIFNADPAVAEAVEDGRTGYVLQRAHAGNLVDAVLSALSTEGAYLRTQAVQAMRENDVDTVSQWSEWIASTIADLKAGRTSRSLVRAVARPPHEVALPNRFRVRPLLPAND